jgi:lactate racemase
VEVALAYGSGRRTITLPDGATTVVAPAHHPAAPDPGAVLRTALASPIGVERLRDRIAPGAAVAISVCDITRPQPRRVMLEALFEELDGRVAPEQVVILVATGTHRASTPAELEEMFGRDIVDRYEIVDHDARDSSTLAWAGEHGAAVPVWLHRRWLEADVRITTGFVEPHFFAGFSGGPKMVAPGLAGLETVLVLHDAARIGDPRATWGICEGNPVHDDVRAIAAATGVDLALDVILNADQQITHAFSGDVLAMHATARDVARRVAMQPVDGLFDVVVTTNSGYPLDQNLYQAVKGMSAAMNIVAPGGTIVCAAECRDGLPDHGLFAELLGAHPTPKALLDAIESSPETRPDQWQAQVLARVRERARVLVHTDGLGDDQLRNAHLEPCHDIEATVRDALRSAGPGARVCVLPEGPQTIPYVRT